MYVEYWKNLKQQVLVYCNAGSLFKACVDGDFAYTELLINNGMPPNTCDYNQRTPLHLAASNGHTHIVHFLCNQPVSDARAACSLDAAPNTLSCGF